MNATATPREGKSMQEKKTGEVPVDGARLSYETVGEGEPLVFVHAGIADSRMWDPQVGAFAGRHRVVRYDMRGFGKSPAVAVAFSHHGDLLGLLDHLGVGRAAIVGCSMGGKVAIDFALENPDRVEALVLVASPVGGFDPDAPRPEEWDEMVAADEAGDLARLSELGVRKWVDGPRRGPGAVDPAVRDLVREMNLIALTNEGSGLLNDEREPEPPAAGRLGEIRAPALVVVGELERPEMLAAADLLVREVPGAERAVMRGTAHLPSMERPEEFNPLVEDFLGRPR